MTRPLSDVERVLRLAEDGLSNKAISRATGVSRAAIRQWLADPARALARPPQTPRSLNCHGGCEPWIDLDERAYAYLLGVYLGDGTISRHARAYRLRIFCDERYVGILCDIERAIGDVMPTTTVGRVQKEGCIEIGSYSVHWPCFFPQHGPGRKHERPIQLKAWQQEIVDRHPRPLLRGLIHSDGCRVLNVAVRTTELAIERRYYTRYHFTNASTDIQRIFTDACDRLGIRWTQSNTRVIAVSRRADVHYLDSFVGPKR